MARKRIGELLLERGTLTSEQLEQGLAHQRMTRQRLGVCLIQKGFLSEEQLANALSEALELPRVDLRNLPPDWAAVHMLRARFCEQHDLFPVALATVGGRKHLIVAMSDPLNTQAIEEIEFTTGLKVSARLAPLSQVRAAIQRCYHKAAPPPAPQPAHDEEIIEGEVVVEPAATRGNGASAGTSSAEKLEALIRAHEEKRRKRPRSAQSPLDAISEDLEFLLGAEPDPVEQLERRFWVLVRIMARKGLLTSDEFAEALAEAESE